MKNFIRILASLTTKISSALVLSLMVITGVAAQTLPAGSLLSNRAETVFFNPRLGITERVFSNTVYALVIEVPSLSVEGTSDLLLARGTIDQHHFTVTNTGNTPLEITGAVDTLDENSMFTNQQLFIDENGNGQIDAHEVSIAANDPLELEIDGQIKLIYRFNIVPEAEIASVATSTLRVNATSIATGAQVPVIETPHGIVTITESGLTLAKSVSHRKTDVGTALTFDLTLRNNGHTDVLGYAEIDGEPILIDGAATTGVVVRDAIPLNTQFLSFGQTSTFQPVFHQVGDAPHLYSTVQPNVVSNIDAIAFVLNADFAVARSADLSFSVLADASLGSVTVRNTAETFDADTPIASNEVTFNAAAPNEASLFFIDENGAQTGFAALDADATLQIIAGACNVSNGIDQVTIQVSSNLTGDAESVMAVETGPNTGVFSSAPLPVTQMDPPAQFDGVLASRDGDYVSAYATCDGLSLTGSVVVNPGSFVFNSVNNTPIAGATILVRDGLGQSVATATSNSSGYFVIGSLPAGQYRYVVSAPSGYAFPSVRLTFPGYGRTTGDFSFGQMFDHPGGIVFFKDIPLDPAYGVPLSLTKTADRTTVSTGQVVTYTLNIRNNMNEALVSSEVIDMIPNGAQLVPGSVSVNGQPFSDPIIDPSGDHIYDLGDISPLAEVTIQYALRFTPVIGEGDVVNIAVLSGLQAGTGQVRTSNTARATVQLSNNGGVFARQGTIVGSVYLDCNENGLRDGAEEMGVAGVKIITQEGLSVVTDINGKYSFPAMRPVSHVLSIMASTLPKNTTVRVTKTADLGRSGTRLVALKRGELRSEDFGLSACSVDVVEAVKTRREGFANRRAEVAALNGDLPINPSQADGRSVRSEAGLATTTQIYQTQPGKTLLKKATRSAENRRTLEQQIKTFDATPAFLDLKNGQRLKTTTVTIRVKGPADLALGVLLNGNPVSEARVGEKTTWDAGNVQAKAYVAVDLRPGENRLELVGNDPYGITRVRHAIKLIAPGKPAQLVIDAPEKAVATPARPIPVKVRILDNSGVQVLASAPVTLRASLGRWNVSDTRPDQPGIQAFISDGEATFGLFPSQVIGVEQLTVTSSFAKATAEIVYTPDLNERILVGVIEGGASTGEVLSPFEETQEGLRGEIYLKSRIRGDALLTLRYSNTAKSDDGLFRDIRTDQGYPVYGDNSERGFDAQSSTNLYIRVEKGRGYGVYGDIQIAPDATNFKLGGYTRLTTGSKAGWSGEKLSMTGFVARTKQRQRVVEFAGRGVTGPYDLNLAGLKDGTDRVEIVVRDDFTGDILSVRPMRRLTDYVLNYFTDTIVFGAPVRQADDQGNPISVRVTFETEDQLADTQWITGGEVNYKPNETTSFGVRAVSVSGPKSGNERERIFAAYAETELAENLTFGIEVAHAKTGLNAEGSAVRAELHYKAESVEFGISASHTDIGFAPSGSALAAGEDRINTFTQLALKDGEALSFSAEFAKNLNNGETRTRADVEYLRVINEFTTARTGLRFEGVPSGDALYATMGVSWTPEKRRGLKFDADLDLPLIGPSAGIVKLGVTSNIRDGWTVSADAEFELDSNGRYDHNNNLRLSTEYAISEWLTGETTLQSDGKNGSNARVHQSLSAKFAVSEQMTLDLGVEVARGFSSNPDALTSFAIGAKWQSEDETWVADANFDVTFETDGHTAFANLGVAGEVTPDLTFLSRVRVAVDGRQNTDHIRARARMGMAYRPIEDPRLSALAWYEYRQESQGGNTVEHLWSIDASYDLNETVTFRGKYAGHKIDQEVTGASIGGISSVTQLAQAGMSMDILDDRAEVGLNAIQLWDNHENKMTALGVELGIVPADGSMISVGFKMSDSAMGDTEGLYQDGFFLRFRMTLDNGLWSILDRFGFE